VLHNGDNEKGRAAALKMNTLYGVRIAGFLEKGQEALGYIFDVFGSYGFQRIYGDKIAEELDKQIMVGEDEFEAVVFWVVNGHKMGVSLYPL
jgi:hypothetical protein